MPDQTAGTDLSERLRSLRVERGWSVRALATRMGVSPATISAIENGHTGVSVARLEHFAAVFGIGSASLLQPHVTPPSRPQASGDDWRVFAPLSLDPVLRAAIAAIVSTGYHGSSMRDIAARAGISLPGVYHYYSGKQQLLVTVFDLTMSELEWRIPLASNHVDEPLTRLHRHVEALALFHVMRSDLAFIGASEMRSLDEPDRSRIAERRSNLQHLLDDDILRAIREGRARCAHPLETSRAIATMCTSLPQWFDIHGPTSADVVAGEYADLALRMIGAHPTSTQGDTENDCP